MDWVIQHSENGKLVARLGGEHSYTTNPKEARVFSSKEAATKEKCGNEHIVSTSDFFQLRPEDF